MAKLRVEIVSKDIIRPSHPTPDHLKTLQFSFRDQIMHPLYMPIVFYYPQNQISNSEILILLKKSLSETLVQFYPLAGRIQGNSSINCNDEGVLFYEASVFASLVQVIENPNNVDDLLRLIPFPPYSSGNTIVFGVQVNHFSCGGMAIGTCLSHKVADASTFVAFSNTWANKARGDSNNNSNGNSKSAPRAEFLSTKFFPYMNLDGIFDPDSAVCKEKIVTRRLIFDKKTLDKLKAKCVEGLQERLPSNGKAVTAFIWKQFIKASKARRVPPKIYGAAQRVNLRPVTSSPILKTAHGNIYWTALARTSTEAEMKYPEAIDKLRNSVKLIDKTFVENMKSGECIAELQKAYEELSPKCEGDFCSFSDCNNFPYYEVNFGWGKPVWVSMTTVPLKDIVFLMGTKCGEGIEAWIHVLEQDVAALEQDHEFVSLLVSRNNIRANM